jgi:beta-lactamase superfamily II metal-dependent hydrolase
MKRLIRFDQFITPFVRGEVLNVGDGDAILLTLEKPGKSLFVVLDGGDESYSSKLLEKVKGRCTELQKDGPDLVICTHYDSDHIAGLITLAEYFGNKIKRIWMHKPPPVVAENYGLLLEALDQASGRVELSESARAFKALRLTRNDPNNRFGFLLESINQAKNLLKIIGDKGIPWEEPFAGECFLKDWPELNILGPTRAFFEKLFQKSTINEWFSKEFNTYIDEDLKGGIPIGSDPCQRLKTNPTTSSINQASVILRIDVGVKKLLFPGDAGLKSFENVVNYPASIQKMSFLKIPHHGSANNITRGLIDLIDPDCAFNSGNTYENPDVMRCLEAKSGRTVKTTRNGNDLAFHF